MSWVCTNGIIFLPIIILPFVRAEYTVAKLPGPKHLCFCLIRRLVLRRRPGRGSGYCTRRGSPLRPGSARHPDIRRRGRAAADGGPGYGSAGFPPDHRNTVRRIGSRMLSSASDCGLNFLLVLVCVVVVTQSPRKPRKA